MTGGQEVPVRFVKQLHHSRAEGRDTNSETMSELVVEINRLRRYMVADKRDGESKDSRQGTRAEPSGLVDSRRTRRVEYTTVLTL